MAKEVKNSSNEKAVSNSRQKRLAREKKASAKKRGAVISNVITWVVVAVLVAGIAALITVNVVKESKKVVAKSAPTEFEDNGFVKGVKASNYTTLCDYKNLTVSRSEIEPSQEDLDSQINEKLELYKELNTESGVVADGDTVNIDYVGSVDGVEFEGGNSNGEGYDLEIGSGSFVDDFEQQLIGKSVGETVDVEVTFPEDYSADLAGQDAVFVVTINGIYTLPEFTDKFVATNLAAYASTTDEYIQYLKDTGYEENLTNYIDSYITDNSTVSKIPNKIIKDVEATTMYADQESFEYMNQMYMQYYGQGYSDLYEYMGVTEEGYMEELKTRAEESGKSILVDQAILEAEGITLSADDVKQFVADTYGEGSYDEFVTEKRIGAVANDAVHAKAREIVKSYATIQ